MPDYHLMKDRLRYRLQGGTVPPMFSTAGITGCADHLAGHSVRNHTLEEYVADQIAKIKRDARHVKSRSRSLLI